jgi:predicted flap endonuclease-1-like 5' DNA nuclease
MNLLFVFILGLLVGWLVEWLIDFFYWRTRYAEREAVYAQNKISTPRTSSVQAVKELETPPAVPVTPDDLKVIKGIGSVIESKLNSAGIYTFEQLGNLTVADLRNILGKAIERLANEESLLQQARDLARRK